MTLDVTKLPTGTSSFTMFIVSQITPDSGSNNVVFSWGTPTTNSTSYRFFYSRLFSNVFRPAISTITSSIPESYNTTNIFNSLNLISNQVTSSADLPYLNGSAFSNIGSRSAYSIGTTNATIGAIDTGSYGNFFVGYLGEIIIYNRSITNTERQQVEGYLAWKWGLQASLPSSTHPYRSSLKKGPYLNYYNPSTIPDCVLWIDAADASSFSLSGSNVTYLQDKVSAIPANIYGTPTWSSTGLDGKRPAFGTNIGAFVFDLSFGIPMVGFTNTIFIVTKLDSTPSAGSCAVGLSTSTTGANSYYRALDYTASRFRVLMDFGTLYLNSGTIGPVVGSSFLYSSTYNGSTGTPAMRNYLKGGTESDSVNVSTNPASGDAAACMVGCDSFTFPGGTPTNYWQNGQIAEVLVFNRVLSDAERFTVDSYLSYKWGLQGDLPSNNPNKNFPPLSVD
jgi:hypothetical protein